MLVYGDAEALEDASAKAEAVRSWVDRAKAARSVAEADDAWAGGLVEVGELAQGLLDAGRLGDGERAMLAARAIARREDPGDLPLDAGLLRVRVPEGYAHYGVHPDAFAACGAHLRSLDPSRRWAVIGIRSIGTSLAAAVAAGLGADAVCTVRPEGHPFRRTLDAADTASIGRVVADRNVAIVDEGPGLSGSSFGAVADALETLGVDEARIVFVPSHPGDLGPEASERHRARWRRAHRVPATLDRDALARAVEDLVGPLEGPLEDVSAGAWRDRVGGGADAPIHAEREGWKLVARSRGRAWLVKHAGLGRYGDAKLHRARDLAELTPVPRPVGLRRGFLVTPWIEGKLARPPIAAIVRHLVAVATTKPPPFRHGASAAELARMAVANAAEAGVRGVEAALATLDPRAIDRLPRVWIDGRMHPWEWVLGDDGTTWKTDAFDHGVAHDLVGPQPIAWDVVGAALELDLLARDLDALVRAASADAASLPFFAITYAAFQVGLARLAADTTRVDPAGAARRYDVARERLAGLAHGDDDRFAIRRNVG